MPNAALAFVLAATLPAVSGLAAATAHPYVPSTDAHQKQNPKPTAKPDQKPREKVEVIALEFVQAHDVSKYLSRTLRVSRRTKSLVVTPHGDSNSVLLRGTAKRISEALDLIAKMDVQPAFQKKGAMTQIVIIEHGKANDIADTLNKFLATSERDDLRIEAHAPNNMLLLRGTKSRIVDSLDLIAQLDRKPSKTAVSPRFVFLEHTKAPEVAATLNRFLDLGESTGPNRGFFVDANKERNAVILRGTSDQVAEALDLIAQIDIKTPANKGRATRTIVLKHAAAKDLAKTLKQFAGPSTGHGMEVGYSKSENALLLKGQEDKMLQVLRLIEQLDTAKTGGTAK